MSFHVKFKGLRLKFLFSCCWNYKYRKNATNDLALVCYASFGCDDAPHLKPISKDAGRVSMQCKSPKAREVIERYVFTYKCIELRFAALFDLQQGRL